MAADLPMRASMSFVKRVGAASVRVGTMAAVRLIALAVAEADDSHTD